MSFIKRKLKSRINCLDQQFEIINVDSIKTSPILKRMDNVQFWGSFLFVFDHLESSQFYALGIALQKVTWKTSLRWLFYLILIG